MDRLAVDNVVDRSGDERIVGALENRWGMKGFCGVVIVGRRLSGA